MKRMLVCAVVLGIGLAAWAQTTQPAKKPAASADEMLNEMFAPSKVEPLRPAAPLLPAPAVGQTDATALTSVAPGTQVQLLLPDGSWVYNRRGVLRQTADGKPEFAYDADGQARQDPPMLVLPNLKLMQMEGAVKQLGGQARFIVSGRVTEYNGRNHILFEKVVAAGQK